MDKQMMFREFAMGHFQKLGPVCYICRNTRRRAATDDDFEKMFSDPNVKQIFDETGKLYTRRTKFIEINVQIVLHLHFTKSGILRV